MTPHRPLRSSRRTSVCLSWSTLSAMLLRVLCVTYADRFAAVVRESGGQSGRIHGRGKANKGKFVQTP
mgnify:FL=1